MQVLDVGLTGGIGCGKSLALSIFKALGCQTLNADVMYHDLIQPGRPLQKKLVKEFGGEILDESGAIDRKKLGAIVFADPTRREQLNKLAHPAVVKEQKRLKKEIRKQLKRENIEQAVIVTDAALMIEAGTYKNYDKVIVVACEPENQKQRIMARNGYSEEEATRRIESQMPVSEKVKYADYVIHNDAGPQELIKEVETVLAKLYESMV